MSATAPTEAAAPPQPDPKDAQIEQLNQQLAAAQDALSAATATKTRKPSAFARETKKIGKALWAAVASTDAVRTEKSLAVLVVTRLLISAGAADGTVKLVQLILKSLGVST